MTELQQQLRTFAEHVANDFSRIDGIQIIVTGRNESGDTVGYSEGVGNINARVGAVREWLTIDDARTRQYGADTAYADGVDAALAERGK